MPLLWKRGDRGVHPSGHAAMSKEDFEVSPTGTHKTINETNMRMKIIGDKIEAALARFQLHHEHMMCFRKWDER